MTTPDQQDINPSERFHSTRQAHRDETAEDYVEAIAQLIKEQDAARVGELAKVMGVSHVTVTRIIARLCKEGLVIREPHNPIFLTDAGREMADESHERHLVVLGFLRAIGVNEHQAQIDAEGIEHHVSAETLAALQRITERLSNPDDA